MQTLTARLVVRYLTGLGDRPNNRLMDPIDLPQTPPGPENGTVAAYVNQWIDGYRDISACPCLLFVSGAQGIGKSTVLNHIAKGSGGRVVAIGLDDFYLSRDDRFRLAKTVHPLFETRGPPGTHDVGLLNQTLDALISATENSSTSIPVFDKSSDDRAAPDAWRTIRGKPEIIIIEGWMMGALPDPDAPQMPPINQIEAADDQGIWRRYQEDQLANAYAKLWDSAHGFLHLDAPGFEVVSQWRLEQERANLGTPSALLSPDRTEWVLRFILHYERLTRRMLAGRRRAGACLKIDRDRQIVSSQRS